MAEDCVTKDICVEKHANANREFSNNKKQLAEHEEKLREADIRFAELSGDVKHIKDRIDNGLSRTITEIREKMDTFIPLVKDSSEWANRFKQAVYFIAVICVAGGIVGLMFQIIGLFAERWILK